MHSVATRLQAIYRGKLTTAALRLTRLVSRGARAVQAAWRAWGVRRDPDWPPCSVEGRRILHRTRRFFAERRRNQLSGWDLTQRQMLRSRLEKASAIKAQSAVRRMLVRRRPWL